MLEWQHKFSTLENKGLKNIDNLQRAKLLIAGAVDPTNKALAGGWDRSVKSRD